MNMSNDGAFQMQPLASPLSVFCAAAPADEPLLAQWETYLLLLQQAHLISCWSTRHVDAGANIEQECSPHLDHADLILLLLSVEFFASEECLAIMQHALERQRAGSARVIPLLLRPVEWQETELAALACLPANGVPVSQWTIQDEAWHACILGLQPLLGRRRSAASLVFTSVCTQQRAASDRKRILGRLRQTYQNLLDRSLYGMAWTELGLASKQDAVSNASHLLLRLPERDEQILPPGTSILHAYEQAQEELLILGAPGAGKSTLLLGLALQLVEHAFADETYPLPVILPLSSWAVQRPPLAAWLIEQCAHIYDIPKKLSQEWVEYEHLLPLLDGLDEMEEIARSTCIAAINIYHSEHLTPLVVCSRQSEYDLAANRERLELQSAVVVQPLTDEHIEASLRTAGPAFAGLRTALDQQLALRELATTPLMLSVLLLTYQGSSLEAVIQPGTNLEQQVWTDYVAQMVQRKGSETRYPLERTCRWLAYLAQQIRAHQQTIFYAEYLHTDWLPNSQQRITTWLTIRVPAIVLGGLAGILVFLFVAGPSSMVSLLQIGLIGGFVGDCLSRNTGTKTATVGNHSSASKRASLMSPILLGVLIAASFGLGLGPQYSLGDWVQDGCILGLGSGLSAWVFLLLLLRRPRQQVSVSSKSPSLRWYVSAWFTTIAPQSIWQAALALGAGIGLSYGLSVGLSIGLIDWLRFGLSIGLIDWLSISLTVVLVSIILAVSLGTLRFAERIHWTWQSLLRPGHLRTSAVVTSMVFFLFGLSFGLSFGLINGLIFGLIDGLSFGLSFGLCTGLSYWLLFGLYQGVVQEHIKDQDRYQFNQGIRRPLRNGMLVSLVSTSIIAGIEVLSDGLYFGLSTGISHGISRGFSHGISQGLNDWLSYGISTMSILVISGFLLMWAMSGGLTILRHYVIRWLLARSHRFPWRAQAFLDDATARILLQRVGGGYRFMHRLLLDHFADMDAFVGTAVAPTNASVASSTLPPTNNQGIVNLSVERNHD